MELVRFFKVGKMGVGKIGQIIGETGVGEMGVGKMGVILIDYISDFGKFAFNLNSRNASDNMSVSFTGTPAHMLYLIIHPCLKLCSFAVS